MANHFKGLIDTHAHLSELVDRETIIQNAKKAGVEAIIAVGTNYETSEITLSWANEYPSYIYPGIGIHPTEWMKDNIQETLKFIKNNINSCIVVGEIGLDYWNRDARNSEEIKETQKKIYIDQLKLAKEKDKPVSVHGRGAWEDALEYALEYGPGKVVFHWYSGSVKVLKKIIENGYYISATPAAEYSKDHRVALLEAPMEKIMIETDCPVYMRNRRRNSEPADVTITLKALADLKELEISKVAQISTKNAKKFFGI